ncbi:MAG: glutathione S-transferase N-terminal domain-containing protein, partial [Beijerinckiaceae bacterium]
MCMNTAYHGGMAKPVLYAHPFSSYCQKALIALYDKGLAFEYRQLGEP